MACYPATLVTGGKWSQCRRALGTRSLTGEAAVRGHGRVTVRVALRVDVAAALERAAFAREEPGRDGALAAALHGL